MEISLLLGNKILSLLIACAIGYIISKIKLIPPKDSEVLSKLLLFVCTPCALVSAYQIEYTNQRAIGLAIAFGLAIVMYGVSILLMKFLGKAFKLTNLERMCVIYSNAGFFVIPLVLFVLGPEWVFYTCASMGTITFLLWTHCKIAISGENKVDWKKILLNPNCVAIYIGFIIFFARIKFPEVITTTLSDFSLLLGPLSMVIIGMLMAEKPLLSIFCKPRAYIISAMRLFLIPGIVLCIFKAVSLFVFHEDLDTIMLIVLWSASSPVGSMIAQFCQLYGDDADYASQITLVSVVFCLISMPLVTLAFTSWI